MSSAVILLVSIGILTAGYIFYGSYLAKQWGIEPKRKTPAHVLEDGVDYVPAKKIVLLGHHFSSIAGAGPINGPIQAAVFGWIPVLLWIVLGGIFFGAVQDFGSLVASIRNEGKSLGEIVAAQIGEKAKTCFTVFAWLVLVLLIAAFTDIVAETFSGFTAEGEKIRENGSVAMASLLFIPLAVVFGLFNRKQRYLAASTAIGIVMLIFCIAAGILLPVYLPKSMWTIIIFAYIFIASVSPVWILLQPRDYLNSFLLYFVMIVAIIGVFFINPEMEAEAFSGWDSSLGGLFPFLFVTVTCGAVSGFHSLIASGTTAKQLDRETDAKVVGFGSMMIECVLAIIALIAVSSAAAGSWDGMTPPQIFAYGITTILKEIGLPTLTSSIIMLLAISAFSLTSLDTATRMGRVLFQEFFSGRKEASLQVLNHSYVATAFTIGAAALLNVAGYMKIWALFGTCNQLVAVLAFFAIACWLKKAGKKYRMLYFPMFFMLAASMTALVFRFAENIRLLTQGTGEIIVEGLQCLLIVPIFLLTLIFSIDSLQTLFRKEKSCQENE